MFNLIKKELYYFLYSYSIYFIMILFLLSNSLFVWVINNENNILNNDFASLNMFFDLTPLMLLIFIPTITMNLFSSEFESGNIENLLTQPIKVELIVLSKYLASLITCFLMILPTLTYIVIIDKISLSGINMGQVASSYVGLIFVIIVFTSFGVLSSVITKSQINAFLLSVLFCFLFYFGIELIKENINSRELNIILSFLSIETHYMSLRNGVIFISDLIYFASLSFIVIFLSIKSIKSYVQN